MPALLLTGDPGTGKTHLLCDVARHRVEQDQPTIVLFGQHFGADDPWGQILRRLQLDCAADVFLDALNTAAESAGGKALIFIDALNESPIASYWRENLRALVNSVLRYPRLGVAVSCRSSFVPMTIPDDLLQSGLVNVGHEGFGDRTTKAIRRFFDYYHLALPDFPLVVPEFNNPLFLKLLCEALSGRGETRFPRGTEAVTTLFAMYLTEVERRLAEPRRCDYPVNRRLVHRSVDVLASEMLNRDAEWLSFDRAEELSQGLLKRDEWSRSLLAGLIAEGILIKDITRVEASGIDTPAVRFAYQRLGDHARAKVVCDRGLEAVREMLATFSAGNWSLDVHSNLLEALAIRAPEQFGLELHLLAADSSARPIQQAFLHSLIWRRTSAFPPNLDEHLKYLEAIDDNSFGETNPPFDTLVEVACVPGHPLNADLLHRRLWPLTMPERDNAWTTYLQEQDSEDSPVARLVEWAWRWETRASLDDGLLLCATTLAWCLSSSNPRVRDRATKIVGGDA